MTRTILLFLFIFSTQVQAQLVPPVKRDGFVYPPGRRVDLDTVLIEAFFDPVCPVSRDAWPPLKQALQHYGSRVALILHLLPLPYHDNAYVTSRALHIVNTANANATFSLLEGFFKDQYSASRGVYGTPTFYVNGFVLSDAASPSDFGGWRKIIDPLVESYKVSSFIVNF